MSFRSSKLTSVNHFKRFMRLLQSCTLPRDPLRPLLLRLEIFSGYTIHILPYAGVSIMPPRVLASGLKPCAKTLRGQLFNTVILTHAWMTSWCFHRKVTIQVRFWLVVQNTTLFGCSFRWPRIFHGSLSRPMKASSNFLHDISSHFLAKNWGVY